MMLPGMSGLDVARHIRRPLAGVPGAVHHRLPRSDAAQRPAGRARRCCRSRSPCARCWASWTSCAAPDAASWRHRAPCPATAQFLLTTPPPGAIFVAPVILHNMTDEPPHHPQQTRAPDHGRALPARPRHRQRDHGGAARLAELLHRPHPVARAGTEGPRRARDRRRPLRLHADAGPAHRPSLGPEAPGRHLLRRVERPSGRGAARRRRQPVRRPRNCERIEALVRRAREEER